MREDPLCSPGLGRHDNSFLCLWNAKQYLQEAPIARFDKLAKVTTEVKFKAEIKETADKEPPTVSKPKASHLTMIPGRDRLLFAPEERINFMVH